MSSLNQSIEYRIKVQGPVDAHIVDWLGPVTIHSTEKAGDESVTTLLGIVADQAGIVGLIRRLHGMGVILLSVERGAAQR